MKLRKAMAIGMAAAMAVSAVPAVASAEEGAYDCGGATLKVFGGFWGNVSSEDLDKVEALKSVEEKYNVKIELSAMEGYDGLNDDDLILTSVSSGDPITDMIVLNPESYTSLEINNVLYDITDLVPDLQIGSIYTQGATWMDRIYGISYDNIGDTWVLVYDRGYLEEIGMEKTPTEMFMEGKWDYENFEAYLAEMKSKLPDDVYPIGNYPYHWGLMAAAANGVNLIGSDGQLNYTDEAVIESTEFYQKLEQEGLAFPMSVTYDEEGNKTDSDIAYALSDERIILKRAEAWQLGGIDYDYGITLWPWGSNVTCDGDYTTLSDNYKVANAYWGFNAIVAASVETTGIPAEVMLAIADDYANAIGDYSYMHAAYEAEQNGEEWLGAEAGEPRSFYTEEDVELYDWAHSRYSADYSWAFDAAGLIDCWKVFETIYATNSDARSTLESYNNEGVAKLEEAGVPQGVTEE